MALWLFFFWRAQGHLEADDHEALGLFAAGTRFIVIRADLWASAIDAPTVNPRINLAIKQVDQAGQDQKPDTQFLQVVLETEWTLWKESVDVVWGRSLPKRVIHAQQRKDLLIVVFWVDGHLEDEAYQVYVLILDSVAIRPRHYRRVMATVFESELG